LTPPEASKLSLHPLSTTHTTTYLPHNFTIAKEGTLQTPDHSETTNMAFGKIYSYPVRLRRRNDTPHRRFHPTSKTLHLAYENA